ncbi:hypothetical protein BaRGS_00007034 [Batillaria attramentaria]|uniref:Uncharacterized protein n=1 Tax=Batillaria attramentaria TaxID=370345 RepID=A0ABD0LRD5_9CAEN
MARIKLWGSRGEVDRVSRQGKLVPLIPAPLSPRMEAQTCLFRASRWHPLHTDIQILNPSPHFCPELSDSPCPKTITRTENLPDDSEELFKGKELSFASADC